MGLQQRDININVLKRVIGDRCDQKYCVEFVCFVQKIIFEVIFKPTFV